MTKYWRENKILKIASFSLATVFGLVVFHAPLSVYFGQYAPPLLVKSWKEILLLLLIPLVALVVWRLGALTQLAQDRLLQLVVAYALLHVTLLLAFNTTASQKLAGLAIDLRYLLFFVLVFVVVGLQPNLRNLFLRVGTWAAGFSFGFAALQIFILPPDILKHIGYSKETIAPYLTVDKNSDFIRINGSLRGPNPLGAYAMVALTIVAAFCTRSRTFFSKYKQDFFVVVAVLLAVLWASYSRSAWAGLVISLSVFCFIRFGRYLRLVHWIVVAATVIFLIGSIFIARDSYFVQNVILHSNPTESESFNSNEAHAVSLKDGLARFARQPLGDGIGSTGSASLFGDRPLVVENQYLFVAHEAGWLGLGLYATVIGLVLRRLYKNRSDWLSLGVFASGIGLVCIGFIQPVFVDDTVSLVWWGVAAIALGASQQRKVKNAKKSH